MTSPRTQHCMVSTTSLRAHLSVSEGLYFFLLCLQYIEVEQPETEKTSKNQVPMEILIFRGRCHVNYHNCLVYSVLNTDFIKDYERNHQQD